MMNVRPLATGKQEVGKPRQESFTMVGAGSRLHFEIVRQKLSYFTEETFDAYLTKMGQPLVM
jgi:hypothetical protein